MFVPKAMSQIQNLRTSSQGLHLLDITRLFRRGKGLGKLVMSKVTECVSGMAAPGGEDQSRKQLRWSRIPGGLPYFLCHLMYEN